MSSDFPNSNTSHNTSDPHEFLVPQSYVARNPESRLVPARRRDMDDHEVDEFGQGPSNALGQFSFAPTTRTTVVTTTTTTTTSFPPLAIKPPRAVRDLDARQYPLAATPTPAALKNLKFKIGEKSIVFNEPDDSASVATEVRASITAVALFRNTNSV